MKKNKKIKTTALGVFGEDGKGTWDHLVSSRWDNAIFKSHQYNATFSLAPYQYKMIEGINFYNHLYPLLEKAPNLDLIQAEITEVNAHDEYAEVTTHKTSYTGDKVFSSLPKRRL